VNLTYICVKRKNMVQSKTELFDKKLQVCAVLFKALAHPARLQILKYLAETKTCITGDISEELPLSRTTVNQHLTELKKAGLIQGHVSGVKMNYCLNPEKISEMKQSLLAFIEEIQIENFKC
jgi:ArsR family transcriptional regulator, arsenate/arsenite/antimonite-responsive transcriptional repressor